MHNNTNLKFSFKSCIDKVFSLLYQIDVNLLAKARRGLACQVLFLSCHFTNGLFASLHICSQYMLMMTASNLYHNTTSSVWTWRNAPHYFHFCTSCFNILNSSWHSLNIVLNNLMSYVWQINSIEYVASLLIVFLGVKSFALATHSRPSWLRQALTLQFWGGVFMCIFSSLPIMSLLTCCGEWWAQHALLPQ